MGDEPILRLCHSFLRYLPQRLPVCVHFVHDRLEKCEDPSQQAASTPACPDALVFRPESASKRSKPALLLLTLRCRLLYVETTKPAVQTPCLNVMQSVQSSQGPWSQMCVEPDRWESRCACSLWSE